MAFDSSFISELKFRLSIDEVIGTHIQLKRAGARYQACCPFHHEKTPSLPFFPTRHRTTVSVAVRAVI